jgi:hypothetical protein
MISIIFAVALILWSCLLGIIRCKLDLSFELLA